MRNIKCTLLLALLSGSLLSTAHAAPYSETFDDGQAQNWSTANATWSVSSPGGYYANGSEVQNAIAYYNAATWTSNFTMNVRMYSDHPASGNKVGAIFGYVDANNYFRVLINMNDANNPHPNNVTLEKVTGGNAGTPLYTGSVDGLLENTWFDVQLVLSGTKLTVRVNNNIALDDVTVSGLTAGNAGVIAQWNSGRFDDFSVTQTASYTQSFTQAPVAWANNSSAWTTTAGYYSNTNDQANPALSYYSGAVLTSDYTYRVRAFADYGNGSGNTVGAVFAYQTVGNYYEVVFNRAGLVQLNKVTGNGTPVTLTSAQACAPANPTCLPTDTYHDVELVLNGMKVSVLIDKKLLINNYVLSSLTAGYIGVESRFNLDRFDDVQLIYPATANLLFKSGYDDTMTIHSPDPCDTVNKDTCFVDISGTDSVSGYAWDSHYLWGGYGRFQTTTGGGINTPADVATYITNERVTVTGPNGTPTKVLHQSINQIPDPKTHTPQDPYLIQNMTSTGARNDLYVRFWMKLQPNPGGTWRILTQWKTGGDYRVSLYLARDFWCTTSTPQYHWAVSADDDANSGLPTIDRKWEVRNMTAAVPLSGQWFKVEFFTHRSAGSDGRVWVAINGETIADYQGSTKVSGEITRVMATQLYTNGGAPNEQWIDDLEIWDDAPADASPITAQTWQTCVDPDGNGT